MSELEVKESYYDLLEVTPNASESEIAAAYRRICAYLGPDSLALYSMMAEDEIEERRQLVERAYHTLSDPDLRAAYDDALAGSPRDGGYPALMVPRTEHGADVSYGRVAAPPAQTVRSPPDDTSQAPALAEPESSEPPPAVTDSASPSDVPAQGPVAARSPDPAPPREVEALQPEEPATESKPEVDAEAPPPVPPRPILSTEARERPGASTPRGFRPPEHMRNLSADQEISGSTLKRLRVACGASINEVAEITKVSKRYLRALEDNDFDALPAPVYVRGFVREYARVFGVDPDVVAASYLALYRRHRGGE